MRGTEVYYFTPYSQPLAAAVSSQIADYFTHNVYSDGADKNRGAKWSYYWVTLQQDFPSIMIETGFVTNEEDALAMANAEHQKNIASRIVKGIQSYISRSDISYSSNASTVVEGLGSFDIEFEDNETNTSASEPEETEGTEDSGDRNDEANDEVNDEGNQDVVFDPFG